MTAEPAPVAPAGDATAPTLANQSFSYAENQVADAVVATVVASDAVGVTGYRFENAGGTPGATSTDGYYTLGSDGKIKITTAGVAAGANNDFETAPNSFTYKVQAGDAAGNWSSAADVTLNVTDVSEGGAGGSGGGSDTTAPTLANQSFSYAENQVADAVVATVVASDAVGVTGYRFENAGGTPGATSTDGYYTLGSDGKIKITTAGVAAGANNDFETAPNSFTYKVQAGDAAGNWSSAADVTLNVTDVSEGGASATITVDNITADNIVTAAEAGGAVAVSGTVTGDAKVGDTVTLTVGTNTYTGLVTAGLVYSIEVPGSVLAANSQVAASVTASDAVGNSVTATASKTYTVDTTASATITVDNITADNIVTAAEAGGAVAVSGTVTGDAKVGDTVTLTVGTNTYTGLVTAGLVYSIEVPGSVLCMHRQRCTQ